MPDVASAGAPRVLVERRDRVLFVTLNRPRVLNALDTHTHAALAAVWDDFERDDGLWLAVLTGAGQRAFSSGQDLKELQARTDAGLRPSSFGSKGLPGWPRLTERFDLSKPIIARVNGDALGGGFELALACDIIIAVENTRFALPEAKLGLIPGAGGIFRLTRHMPYKTAIGHLITGRPISAESALAFGLVNEVCPRADLDSCVDRWIEDILRCAPLSVRAIKAAAAQSSHLPMGAAFDARYPAEEHRRNSKDTLEGPRAFIEKRMPVWHGR